MYIEKTVQWIQSIIIPLNLCPFAKREMDSRTVRIEVSSAITFEQGINDFIKEIDYLNLNPKTNTTLLLFPHFLSDFLDYLDFTALADKTLVEAGYEGTYQLATFHPQYQFHNTKIDCVTNYTNRSPYPTVHLLREGMLERAIAYYGNTEEIPENNIHHLQRLGLAEVIKLWTGLSK